MSSVVADKLGQYLGDHPEEARNIINKAVVASRAREAARKARKMGRADLLATNLVQRYT